MDILKELTLLRVNDNVPSLLDFWSVKHMIDSFEFSAFRTTPTGPSVAKGTLPTSCKTPEFFEKSPSSGAKKHQNYTVTLCIQNDTTDTNFSYIES